jgi:hypothetical protein
LDLYSNFKFFFVIHYFYELLFNIYIVFNNLIEWIYNLKVIFFFKSLINFMNFINYDMYIIFNIQIDWIEVMIPFYGHSNYDLLNSCTRSSLMSSN